jgi:hypothetical protein
MSERVVTLDELRDLVKRAGTKLSAVAKVAMRASTVAMMADAVRNRMSGQYLGVVTGTGRRSVQLSPEVRALGDRISGSIGSPLNYIRAHEEGYKGPVAVPAHSVRAHVRRGRIVSRRGARRRIQVPAHTRKAHTRQANIRARRFLRDTLYQETGQLPGLLASGASPFSRRMLRALTILVEQNRMPRVAELGV